MNEDDKKLENQINTAENDNDSNEQVKSEVENKANLEQQEGNIQEERNSNEVIHKKDGRLHIYVRQDKYKGELKSKNWVGRLYINGKQKISSSRTKNLDEAI
ncbi:MAG: pilus assembly protein PilS, partial [Pelagibacteraceae bacterium]